MGSEGDLVTWAPTRSRDHVARALERFTEQFREKPHLSAMLSSYIARVQEIEDAALEVLDARPNPIGIALDRVGALVGRGRGDLDDANYLRAIFAQILANRSSGEADVLLHIFELVTDDTTSAEVFEPGFATLVFVAHGVFPLESTWQILVLAKGGGVRLFMTYSPDGVTEDDFAFEGDEPGEGWGSVYDATIGGKLRGVFDA
jgi:hypothetical protein